MSTKPELNHRLLVPSVFWDDHCERCGGGDPDAAGVCGGYDDHHPGRHRELRVVGRCTEIEMDDTRLADLESDADYYGDASGGPDDEHSVRVLRPSARATVRRIDAYRRGRT